MNTVWVEGARLDNLLEFRNRDFRSRRHVGIEVPRGLAEHQVARRIGAPRLDDRKVRPKPFLAHVKLSIEFFDGLSLGDDCPDAGSRVERGNTGAACTDSFRERPLRIVLKLELA